MAKLQGTPLLMTISTLTAISFMLIGYDNGVIGGLTGSRGWNETLDYPRGDALSTIVAIYEVGCFLGAIATFVVGERIGRRRTLALGAVWMAVGAILQATTYSRVQIIVGRTVSGIGMGLINSTAPVLQAEVSPKASRGRFVCAQLSTLNLGIFLAYWIDYGTTKHMSNDFAWRFPIAFQLVLILIIFILSFVICESPTWLAFHDQKNESLKAVARLNGSSEHDPIVQERWMEILSAVQYEKQSGVQSWRQMFVNDDQQCLRRLLIACSVQFCQQLGGINGVIYYANYLFSNSLGFDADMASLMSGFLFTWFFLASFIPWFLIDSVGRRPLLIGSVTFMACLFVGLAITIKQVEENTSSSHTCGIVATVFAFLYMGAFTTGFQATVWVYPPEILPLKIRAKGTALATSCNWIINFAVVEVFPIAIDNIGWKTYVIFAVFNAAFLPGMYLFYPETKGKSLEEIDLLFGSQNRMEGARSLGLDQNEGCDNEKSTQVRIA